MGHMNGNLEHIHDMNGDTLQLTPENMNIITGNLEIDLYFCYVFIEV